MCLYCVCSMHRTSITSEAPRFILKVVSGSYLSSLQLRTAGMSGVLLSRQLKMEPSENLSVGVDPDATPTPVALDTAVLLLGAGVTAVTHPLLYVKLLIQVGHEPLPPTVGTTMFGRRVLYLPGFFSYAQHIVKVDGKRGLFRGFSPRFITSAISTMVRSNVKQQVELLAKRDDLQTSLKKVVKETTHEMIIQCLSRVATHPFHVMSVRCMAQFVGREVKYSGMISCITNIFKEEGVAGFYVGLIPHMLGEVLFLWCCNLLSHLINTYAVDDSFSQASAVRSYTKFVMGIAVSILTYPFMLVADLMAVNNCGLAAGLPPRSPIFKSWLHCWSHLSHKGQLYRGSSFFSRWVPVTSLPSIEN
ncbi:mitochondrial carrier homolog 1 isoform X3 [Hippoglossus stenolepis]|uniref:mitochondrial carrier homolog 1 isoform X3 n=1 Tax=Hippoglossus stenolepis TaxID=195615 RepID=UPI00159C426C|nr:mitochondrial carrier homolog 1 isoform X3 [Hippoglossus stenolepis]